MGTFSEGQIDAIFLRWYNGEKVDSLLKELGIEKIPSRSFAKYFSPLPCEIPCPYCHEDMSAYRSDSAHYNKTKKLYNISTAHCLICDHDSKTVLCRCEGCELIRKEQERISVENEAKRIAERQKHLERLYDKIVPVNFEKAELIELIYLYALCYQSSCEEITLISPPSIAESCLSPCDDLSKDMIQDLLKYVTPFCDDEKLLSINEDGEVIWSGQNVFYRFKIETLNQTDFLEALLSHIKNRVGNLSLDNKFALASLFERLMIAECITYLEHMRISFDLPHESGLKTAALFKKLIQSWRIDQIYNIIWGRCKDALAYKVQNGLPRLHASNMIIGMIDKFVDRATQNNWEIKNFYRDSNNIKIRQSTLSYVLFNKIFELSGLGIEYCYQDVLTKLEHFNQLHHENIDVVK